MTIDSRLWYRFARWHLQMHRKASNTHLAPDAASPPPNLSQVPDLDDVEHPDIPIWRKEYSYRGGPYR